MDLKSLLKAAHESETPAGTQRAEEIANQLRALDVNLDELAEAGSARFEELYNDGDFTRDQETTLYALGDLVDAVAAVRDERAQAQAQVAELADRVRTATSPAGGEAAETSENAGTAETDSQPSEDTNQGESAPEQPPAEEDTTGTDTEPTSTPDGTTTEQAEPVAASANRRPSTAAAVKEVQAQNNGSSAPAPATPKPLRSFSVTAAADVPDTPMGKSLSMRELGESTLARFRDMPLGQPDVGVVRKSIANVNRHFDESLVADGYDSGTADVVDRVADESRLPGGSLVAAAQQQLEDHQRALTAGAPLPTPPGDIFCAPSETDYSLCPPLATARTGILDLPSFSVRRGGIRYPVWHQYPDFHRPSDPTDLTKYGHKDPDNDYYAEDRPNQAEHDRHGYVEHYNDHLKNPNHFVENPKKCIEGPCVEWQEERMSLSYLCITGDILRDRVGYPELAERFMSDALVSHEHFLNETYIREIVSKSDRLPPFDANAPGVTHPSGATGPVIAPGPLSPPYPSTTKGTAPEAYLDTTNSYWPGNPQTDVASMARFGMGSGAEAILERLGSLVTWFKDAYRTAFTKSWDGFAPFWLREFLKLDLERKTNRPNGLPVSNAEVDALFQMWGVRMQWVYDWQSYPSGETPDRARVMPPDGWPNNVDIVLFPAGAWALAQQNILRVSGEYDSTQLRTQKYTRLFMEDGWMLLNRCNRSFVVTLRNLCANGAVGARRDSCTITGTTVQQVTTSGPNSVTVGSTIDLTASAVSADGFSKDVTTAATWESSDTSIATVDAGTVTGVADGSATITATYKGVRSAGHAITVNPAAQAQTSSKSSKSSD